LNEDMGAKEWDEKLETLNAAPLQADKAIYFTAICSDKPIKHLELKQLAAIAEHWSAREQQQVKKEADALAARNQEIEALLEKTEDDLRKIYGSRSWRALSVFYRFENRLKRLLHQRSA